jgi:hypothetical protein
MPIDAVQPHPRHAEIIGVAPAESRELLRASVRAKGFVTPLLITPPDAKQNASCAVDGNVRLLIGREEGLTEIPAIVDPTLQTEVEQVERMVAVAQRVDYTPSQRARQAAAFRAYLLSLPPSERRERYGDKEPMQIVALVVSRNRNHVHQLDVVFTSVSSTEELKAAVDKGRLSLRQAYRIITKVERRRVPGSTGAKDLVNRLLAQLLATRREKRRRGEPRTPVFSASPKPASFLIDLQRQVADWAMSQSPDEARNSALHAASIHAAVRDLMVELRAATSGFKARLQRLVKLLSDETKADSVLALNESLQVLTLKPVTHVNGVDLAEVKRTHRLLARAYHPDLNASQGARDEFERVHRAYEQVLTICDQ